MNRLDGIENRISALEIATKEVLNNQRTISTQQRKLQDAVDVPKMTPPPPPVPIQHQQHQQHPVPVPVQHYEEPKRQQIYHQAPMPTGGPVMVHPPPSAHSHMPALVPVTHISNRGERIDSYSSMPSGKDQYSTDLELAKRLQAEFDSQPSSNSSSSSSNSNSYSSAANYSAPRDFKPIAASQPPKSSGGQQECPICQTRVAIGDLEAHVEQHFEDEEAKRVIKPGDKPINKNEAKAGFFAKLFGPKPEEQQLQRPANTDSQPTTQPQTTAPSASVPYTHTSPHAATTSPAAAAAYNQRMGYYPNMAAQPGHYRPPAAYYGGYPMPQQMARPQQGNPPQQYLYYPSLDQPPQ